MKKNILILLVSLTALTLFAQENTTTEEVKEPTINLYGSFRVDYDLTKDDIDADIPVLDGFNIARARVGSTWTISDKLSTKVEYDLSGNVLRIAKVDWSLNDKATLTIGRQSGIFGPESEWGSDRHEAIAFDYTAGIVNAGLQVANNIGGNGPVVLFPAVAVTPDLGDIELTVGANARYSTRHHASTTTTVYNIPAGLTAETVIEPTTTTEKERIDAKTDLNAFVTFGISELSFKASGEFNSLEDDMTFGANTDVNYNISDVNVGLSAVFNNLIHEDHNIATNLCGYISKPVTEGLTVKLQGDFKNIADEDKAEEGNDYTFTLRFQYSPKYNF